MKDQRNIPLERIGDKHAIALLAQNFRKANERKAILDKAKADLMKGDVIDPHELKAIEFWIDVIEMILRNTEAQDLSTTFCSDLIAKYEKRFGELKQSWDGWRGELVRVIIVAAIFIGDKLLFS